MPQKREEALTAPAVPKQIDVIKYNGYSIEAEKLAEGLIVTDDKSEVKAIDVVKRIKNFAKEAEDARTDYVAPFNEFVKRVNAAFKPIANSFAAAESKIKMKILAYQQKREAAAREAQRQQEEKYRQDLASQLHEDDIFGGEPTPLAAPPPTIIAPTTVSGSVGTSSQRKNWTYEITDESLIPRQYLMVDEKKIRGYVTTFKEKAVIPGVRVYQETGLSIR